MCQDFFYLLGGWFRLALTASSRSCSKWKLDLKIGTQNMCSELHFDIKTSSLTHTRTHIQTQVFEDAIKYAATGAIIILQNMFVDLTAARNLCVSITFLAVLYVNCFCEAGHNALTSGTEFTI